MKSRRTRPHASAQHHAVDALSLFSSDLGWIGLVGRGGRVTALSFGHDTPVQVRLHLEKKTAVPTEIPESDWSPEFRERLQAYAGGEPVGFADVDICTEGLTPFRQSVVSALRQVGYGQTLSYAELAALAGSPLAARAVGGAMAANRIPLIVPCHRVIASGGRLGGFSAPSGLTMKQRLLQLEQAVDVIFDPVQDACVTV